ncbi:hypothetical protein D7D25_09975 [Proteiniphilum sp. X52]|nr:hypothetical protein D7D25_09975 [Proteiniphilum sp. X52]
MKDKRLIISWPLFAFTFFIYFYIYKKNPLDKMYDFGLINIVLLLFVIIINYILKEKYTRHMVTIILFLIFIGIYFLI